MATESPIRMLESDESTKWLPTKDPSMFSSHFCNVSSNEGMNKVFKERIILERQTHNVPNRSGSAPPTIEGSIAAFRAFMDQRNLTSTSSSNEFLDCESEEQMRTDPSYIAYYYANVKMNPRLPPPLISRENRDFVRLMGAFGGRKALVTEGLMTTHKEEPEEAESLSKASGDQKESFGDEAKMTYSSAHSESSVNQTEGNFIHASSPAHSTAANEEAGHDIHKVSTTDQILHVQDSCPVSVNSCTLNSSNNFSAATSNFCTRNTELEDNASNQSIMGSDISVVESRMKLLDVSCEIKSEDVQNRCDNLPPLNNPNQVLFHPIQDATYHLHGFQGYAIPRGTYTVHQKPLLLHHQSLMPNPGQIPPLYSSTAAYMNSGNLVYPHVPQPGFPGAQFGFRGYNINSIFAPQYTKYFRENAFPTLGEVNPYTSQVLRPPFGVPLQGQYFQPPFGDSQRPAQSSDVSSMISVKELNISTIERPVISSTNGPHISATYYGYPNASMNSQKSIAVPSGTKAQRGPESSDNSKRHCFLELLKSSSSRTFGLSDISGQIVEFSTDQHGSRFIQQKLENCGNEEKESVFKEILPHCSKLMTDVFGNYVVQKFFEHGTAEQRKKLGLQITGQVLTLSLQMYGCRVIQKALEVIELDQKVNLVQELDGHVLRCVHDQNGNHVIQKCIEYLPTEKINFIISSFAGQVATLSCHPYGCRVIQRVLEHCSDEKINEWIVDEILESTAILAKDPYGNYVTQHILEMGKPQQRSHIIQKLRGQFVQLSQHKFASNVVEKCLKFGNGSEQDFITEEILAQADNNEALLVMMKDQFANYVIQRIFEIGSEKQKDTLRNCIRLNLPLLKKVTYAKHIVSRYEQLEVGSEQERIKQSAKMDDTS